MQTFALEPHHSNGKGSDDRNDTTSSDNDYVLALETCDTGLPDDHQSSSTASVTMKCKGVLSSIHAFSGKVVNDDIVQRVIMSMIIISSITMGLATFPVIRDNATWTARFDTMDRIFLYIFSTKLMLHFVWNGLGLFRDGWLTFDCLVILMSWVFLQAQVIRAFRVIRTFRIVTRIPELKELVDALLSAIPCMAAIVALLVLVFYIFAVMFTQLFHDLHNEGYTDLDYFSRLDVTFFTLFQLLLLDNWSEITRQCMQRYPWAWVIFVAFTITSTFIVVNLMIVVICNAVSIVPQQSTAKEPVMELKPSRNLHAQVEPADDVAKLQARIDEIYAILKTLQENQQKNHKEDT